MVPSSSPEILEGCWEQHHGKQLLRLEGHFRHPERYEYLHGLACATLLRFAGIAAPTIDELREALARIIADADE